MTSALYDKATANQIKRFWGTTERLNRDGGKSEYFFSVIISCVLVVFINGVAVSPDKRSDVSK
jgi:hypothetical protein